MQLNLIVIITLILVVATISLQVFGYFYPGLISSKIYQYQYDLKKQICSDSIKLQTAILEERCRDEGRSIKQAYDSEIEKIKSDLQKEIETCKTDLQNSVSTGAITSEQATKAYEQKILELQGNFEKEKLELQKAADTLLNQAVESKTACELNVATLNQKIKELESKLVV